MACPGSIRLARQVPAPAESDAAREGTRAHAVAELALSGSADCGDPYDYVGGEIEGGTVGEDMAAAVKVYTDHCQEIIARPGVRYWIERKFSLAELSPPEPMYGTCDFCAYEPAVRTLYVSDLKFGAGVLVEVLDSKQLRYYALGALLSLLKEDPNIVVERIVMTIVQPRMSHSDGAVRSWEITLADLFAFARELLAAANATQAADAPLVAGSHCKFCPAEGVCPARREQMQLMAQDEFGVEVTEASTLPSPETLPIAELARMMPYMDAFEEWIKACRQHAYARLAAGLEVPGYKLVATRATRKFTDAAEVVQALEAMCIPEDSTHEPRKLKSVAQIEKVLGKKVFNQSPLVALVEKKSGGTKMVPDSDPSPAVTVTRGEEFLALPSGSEE